MARYSDEGVIPISRERLWQFLDLHTRADSITLIHPGVVSQRIITQSESEVVVAREIEFRGTARPNTWKLTSHPPDSLRWEVLEAPQGPMQPGTWVENHYSDVPGGTRIVTEGEIAVVGVPRFLMSRIARSVMNRIDKQDRDYLRQNP